MPELPPKKVGIISCSGEELPEGTISRLATLRVLEQSRPANTVTICLPLFLAGGEGDRAFARFYPTIAVDGCDKRCAFYGTSQYSNQPAASIVVSDLIKEQLLPAPHGRRKLDKAGEEAVDSIAHKITAAVDEILSQGWDRRQGEFERADLPAGRQQDSSTACACQSEIPSGKVMLAGIEISLVALPLIFETFLEKRKTPSVETAKEMMEMLKIYNRIDPQMENEIQQAVLAEFTLEFEKLKP